MAWNFEYHTVSLSTDCLKHIEWPNDYDFCKSTSRELSVLLKAHLLFHEVD